MAGADDASKTHDTDALKRKYREERDKRMRDDGGAQYLDTTGEYADFVNDPYIAEPLKRSAVTEEIDVAVIGGGFGGLLTAVELRKASISSFRIIDVAGDFGGTWYWNRYPGVRCDIEAYCYMPLLEEVGTVPAERYASGAEIFEHCRAIGRRYGLYEHTLFQTKVMSITWSEARSRWIIRTDRGDEVCARFVTVSQGPLAKVKLPGIPGIKSFKGKVFHSSRWDFDYTGGDTSGGLSKLADKRVAVIGTGATAVQIVPKLADAAKEVLIFQRTPSALAPRNNTRTDMDWFRGQPHGWQRQRMDNFLANITPASHPTGDVVNDGWTDFFKRVGARMKASHQAGKPFDPNDVFQEVDYEKMQELRRRTMEIVRDPNVAASILPWYNYLCKRPLFSDDYLECLNLPGVKVIDTDGRGVERMSETSVHANNKAFEVDCIIFATGFDVGAAAHKVGGYKLTGRNGVDIDTAWADGMRTVHGTQMHGFPNFHIVGGTEQGTTAFNFTHTLQMQASHAVDIIRTCRARGVETLEVTAAAEDRWLDMLKTPHAIDLVRYFGACTPGFLNNEGNLNDKPTFLGGTYGGGPIKYNKLITDWRFGPQMQEDTVVTYASTMVDA